MHKTVNPNFVNRNDRTQPARTNRPAHCHTCRRPLCLVGRCPHRSDFTCALCCRECIGGEGTSTSLPPTPAKPPPMQALIRPDMEADARAGAEPMCKWALCPHQ